MINNTYNIKINKKYNNNRMKFSLFLTYIERLLFNYSIIIERLILYNENYNGKLKEVINKNLNTIKYLIILFQEISILINHKKIDEFFKLIDGINLKNYILTDITNKSIFFYHININDYNVYVELFEYLKKILSNIQIFFREIITIKTEINIKISHLQRKQIIIKSSSSLDYYRKTLETLNIKKSSGSVTKKIIINDIIRYIYSLKKRNNKKFIELKNVLNENDIYIFDEDDEIIKRNLEKENKETLNKINEFVLSKYMKLSSEKKEGEIINEIIFRLINFYLNDLLEEIRSVITSNFNIKQHSKNDEEIILEIINIVIFGTNIIRRKKDISNLINKYYNKKENSESNKDVINKIINLILEIRENKKEIIRNIKSELNINQIFILDKYFKENDYKILIKFIDEIRNMLREQDNKTLKKINKILSNFKIDIFIDKDLVNLHKYYTFINTFDNINIFEIDKILYMINESNEIKKEIEQSNLLNPDIKQLFLDKIIYYSYDLLDNINVEVGKFFIPINKNKVEIIKLEKKHINDIMNIIELYNKLVNSNLTDNKIREIINVILKINNHNLYEYLNNNFIIINLHYKFDYNFIYINNYDKFKEYLDKFYLYKNYINVIIKLYEYLLFIKDNFNLIYSIIEKIKKRIELYKKIDNTLMEILFEKLNMVNTKKNNGIIFRNYKDIDIYLEKLIN
jgi:hypothetical protein